MGNKFLSGTPFNIWYDPTSPSVPFMEIIGNKEVLTFIDSLDSTAYWLLVAKSEITLPLVLKLQYFMEAATSGVMQIELAFECITPGDALNLNGALGFDYINKTSQAVTVPTTAGYLAEASITLSNSNIDNLAAGDLCMIDFRRVAGGNTASGNLHLLSLELWDSAA